MKKLKISLDLPFPCAIVSIPKGTNHMLNHTDIEILKQFQNYCRNTQKNLFDFYVLADLDSTPQPMELFFGDTAESAYCSMNNVDIERDGNRFTMSQDGQEQAFSHNLIQLLFQFYAAATMAKFRQNYEDSREEMAESNEWEEENY